MQPGDLVVPSMGRDKGRLMLVVGLNPEPVLADGRLRRIEKPKVKRKKHLVRLARGEGPVPDKLRKGEKVTNAEIRRTIAEIRLE